MKEISVFSGFYRYLVVVVGEGDLIPVVEVIEIWGKIPDAKLEPPLARAVGAQLVRQLLLNLKKMIQSIIFRKKMSTFVNLVKAVLSYFFVKKYFGSDLKVLLKVLDNLAFGEFR